MGDRFVGDATLNEERFSDNERAAEVPVVDDADAEFGGCVWA